MSDGKGGGKNRKYGRNKVFCKAYLARDVRRVNKIRKLKRHLKKYVNDAQAGLALEKLKPA